MGRARYLTEDQQPVAKKAYRLALTETPRYVRKYHASVWEHALSRYQLRGMLKADGKRCGDAGCQGRFDLLPDCRSRVHVDSSYVRLCRLCAEGVFCQ